MRPLSMLFIALSLICLECQAIAGASPAYQQGVAEARADIQQKIALHYGYGLMMMRQWNPETGLPVQSIAGCIVDDAIQDRARGYNDTMSAWLRAGGQPVNSLAPWAEAFQDLPAFWGSMAGNPGLLTGDPATATDGKYTVSLGTPTQYGMILNVGTDGPAVQVHISADAGSPIHFRWGPAGSETVIVRSVREDVTHFVLVDLHRGLRLDQQGEKRPSTQPASAG